MEIMLGKKKAKYTVEPGLVQAVCYAMWNIGKQEVQYQGQLKHKNQIVVAWELDQRIDDPESDYHNKRLVVNKKYAIPESHNIKSSLIIDFGSWRGKPIAEGETLKLHEFLGLSCMLNIVVNENGYPGIQSISPLMKKMEPMKSEIDTTPPKWIVELAEKSLEPVSEIVILPF
jgi:hypothetical protein